MKIIFQIIKSQDKRIIIDKTPVFPNSLVVHGTAKIIEDNTKGIKREKTSPMVSSTGLNQCLRAISIMYSFCSSLNAISSYI